MSKIEKALEIVNKEIDGNKGPIYRFDVNETIEISKALEHAKQLEIDIEVVKAERYEARKHAISLALGESMFTFDTYQKLKEKINKKIKDLEQNDIEWATLQSESTGEDYLFYRDLRQRYAVVLKELKELVPSKDE